jgi:copper(I)-binding protein
VRRWRAAFVGCFSLAALATAACSAGDSPPAAATMFVTGAWARAADSGATTAVYFTLRNAADSADTLVSATTTDARTAEMHISTQHGSMMHMSQIRALPVPAHDSVEFRPLGAHVMLVELVRPLVEGDSVRAVLVFSSARSVTVEARVQRSRP